MTIPTMLSMASSKSSPRSSSRFFVLGISLTARRLPPLAPQVSQIGNAALVEREAFTLPLDYAFGLSLPEVRAAAIEVHGQCRRAGGRGLSGSRSRDRLGDRRDGLGNSVISVASRQDSSLPLPAA
jgi:hypothetical protein